VTKQGGWPALTLTAMSLGFTVVQLDVTIVNVALPAMGPTYGGGMSSLQWVVSAYTIAFASLILGAGALGDRIGAKKGIRRGPCHFHHRINGLCLGPNTGRAYRSTNGSRHRRGGFGA
jgi:DHA2 family methylenomycin A resistance protein-like MFS transporter